MHKALYMFGIGVTAVSLGLAVPSPAVTTAVKANISGFALAVQRIHAVRPVVVATQPVAPPRVAPPSPPPLAIAPSHSQPPTTVSIGGSPLEECQDQCGDSSVASNQDDSIYMDYDLFVVVEGGIRLPEELR